MAATRIEHDLLGDKAIPADAYYGVQTARALENFHISGVELRLYPDIIRGFAMVKLAAARANFDCGVFSKEILTAIETACQELVDGKLHDLWMKALALEDAAGHRIVLITSDFQGVPKGMSDRVFARLKQEHALDRADVMLTFSHNHCGPRLGDDLVDYYPVEAEQVELVREYTDLMVDECVKLVGAALSDLAPARLAQGALELALATSGPR